MIQRKMIYRRTIPEDRLDGRRLGRHVVHDPRSRDYPAETASKLVSVVHTAVGLPLDQGQVGSCTANALCGALNSQPDYTAGHVFTEVDAVKLYEVETRLEGSPWSASNPAVNDVGGSGLMVCRAAKLLGWIKSYRHAFGLDHALLALVKRPVIFGVDWTDGFDKPDKNGIVRVSGAVRGGHEFVADEIDTARGLVGCWNSWNTVYGLGGKFYIPFEDLSELLDAQGDCTVPYPA